MKKYALVVDDHYFTREIIRQLLEEIGYEVIEASNGEEAVDIFKNNSQKLRLITMDYNMPVKNGVEAIREIRAINQQTPIIGISAAASAMRVQLNQEINIYILNKPIDKPALILAVRELDFDES